MTRARQIEWSTLISTLLGSDAPSFTIREDGIHLK